MSQSILVHERDGERDAASASARAHSIPLTAAAALGRVWLAVNLLALAALGVALAPTTPSSLLTGWICFTVLNGVLLWCARSGLLVGNAAAGSATFNASVAAVLGLTWGAGVALLTPHAGSNAFGVLVCAAMTVALTAVPVFGAWRHAFVYFVATFCTVSVAGILRDGHYPYAALWLAFGCISLLVIADVYFRNIDILRRGLRAVASAAEPGGSVASSLSSFDDAGLLLAAFERSDALSGASAEAQRKTDVLKSLTDAIVVTDPDGKVEFVNPLGEVLTGLEHKAMVGKSLEQAIRVFIPPDKRNAIRDAFEQARLTRKPQRGANNAQLTRHDGVVYGIDYTLTPLRSELGDFNGCVVSLRDVTETRHRSESMAWQATHDALTGAINRPEFELRLKKLVKRAQDGENIHTLMFLDLDRFKRINDNYGHAAGDAALKELSHLLRQRIRGADTLARIGGDEFAALLYSCPQDKARLIAEGLRTAVERHEFEWQGISLPISISVGIVEINQDCKSTPEILRAADSACFSAKKFGRNRVELFERMQENKVQHARVFDFVKDIQTAIQGNRMELFHQPLLAAAGGDAQAPRCALSVGMRNKAGELMPRREVLDLAARYQLIEEIDRWVVKAAIDALRLHHPTLDGMSLVLVSLSQPSMTDERLLDDIVAMIDEHPEVGNRLGFSFDESGIGGQTEQVRFFMSRLRQFGCRFMVSDMGFGHESIATVKSLNADFLGIGAPLVQGMLANTVDYEVVLGMSRVAHALGMETIADGADSSSLTEALGKMGVDYIRGVPGEQPRSISIHSDAQWI